MIRLALAAAAVAMTAAVAPMKAPMKWTTHMRPQGSSKIEGDATVTPDGADKMTVHVIIAAASPNKVYPWHIHTGKCPSGGIYGPAAAYTPIKTDGYGAGEVTVTIPIAAPESGEYHVNVHASPTDMGTIVSCGDLEMKM